MKGAFGGLGVVYGFGFERLEKSFFGLGPTGLAFFIRFRVEAFFGERFGDEKLYWVLYTYTLDPALTRKLVLFR